VAGSEGYWIMSKAAKPPRMRKRRLKSLSTAKLDELIEEAIVDAYGESEQIGGFYTMLEDHLAVPFAIDMLGVEVTVKRVDLTRDDHIVAVCEHGTSRQRIPILDVPHPDPQPAGWEWVEAHRRWARGR
jgi:hypothetical protein